MKSFHFLLVLLILLFWANLLIGQPVPTQFHQKFQQLHLPDHRLQLDKQLLHFKPHDTGDSLNVRLISHWAYGSCHTVAVAENIAYFANGFYLEIVDISNPASPMELSNILVTGTILEVAVTGNYAYVAAGEAGLRVIDISNSTNPQEVGYFDTAGEACDVALVNNYAYVADWFAGLRIIDISNATNPREVGYFDTGGYVRGVASSGNYSYLADYTNGLRIIEVSDVTDPQEVGFLDIEGAEAWRVAVSGDYAYVAELTPGLRVIDISSATNPQEVAYLEMKEEAWHVAVSGNYAYVADNTAGLRMIDISDVTNPQEVSYFMTEGQAVGVTIKNPYAYVADWSDGLLILDVSSITEPQVVGHFGTGGYANSVALSGNYAYVTEVSAGLRVFDVSNGTNPQEMGCFDTGCQANDVAVSGNYACVADGLGGLRIIDVSNATNLQELGYFDTGGYAVAVALNGNYTYVADGGGGLRIIDVSNVSNPQEVGYLDTGGYAWGVAVSGHYAYVADGGDGLRIIDVSNVINPHEIGHFDTGGYARGVALSGHCAYVADYEAGLRVIDVSIATNPKEVGHFDTGSYAYGVKINGDYVYVADFVAGLRVIDVSNANNPQEVGYFDTDDFAIGLTVSGNYAYVADGNDGFYILEFLGMPPNSPTLSQPANNSFFNDKTPLLTWLVPSDSDGDSLHFKVELATNSNFTSQITGSPFESQNSTSGFNPPPPVAEGSDSCSFTPPSGLADGVYWWRVSAWDGKYYSDNSVSRKFTVDTVKPYTSSHSPVKNATNVAVNTNITVHVQDAVSGVKRSSIKMQVNGNQVIPIITGSASDYTVDYIPANDFSYNQTVTVTIEAEDNAGNRMVTDSYYFSTVTDSVPPYTSEHNPAPGATDVATNTNIVLHIKDTISGVKKSSIVMQVNGNSVTPTITGTPANYTVTYDPATDFGMEQTVTVSISAEDLAGNIMIPNSYSFTTAGAGNIAPASPILISPNDGSYTNVTTPQLSWLVPTDPNNDPLHFKVEISISENFANQVAGSPFESQQSTIGFIPKPPTAAGSGSCSYTLQSALNDDGTYYWRVSARDDFSYGSPSNLWGFIIDSTPPSGATAVSVDTSRNLSFTVAWGGSATDGSGAGISGHYDVNVRTESGTWQNWLSHFQGDSAVFTGNHGETYYFEAAAWDKVGNREPFTGDAETATVVDTSTWHPLSDFVLLVTPETQSIKAGETATYEVTLQSLQGFNQTVTLSISNLPAATTADFSLPAIDIHSISYLSVNTELTAASGQYTLVITGTVSPGFYRTAEIVLVIEGFQLGATPNPFTPNEDGYNDFVLFNYPELKESSGSIQIFNFRGKLVSELKNSCRWSGKNDQGEPLPPGVYLFVVKVNGKMTAKGPITLIR